ncbi:hypothetical protein GF324_13310 [bacterium]|nr:hypothetical protein [bacterium]
MVLYQFSRTDWEFLLRWYPDMPVSLRRTLEEGKPRGKRIEVDFTEPDAVELLDVIAEIVPSMSRADRRQAKHLRNRLVSTFSALEWSGSSGEDDTVSPGHRDGLTTEDEAASLFREMIEKEMKGMGADDVAFMQDFLSKAAEEFNTTPQEGLGGYSPREFHALFYADFMSDTSAVKLNEAIPLKELEAGELLVNARSFLEILQEENGTKMTQSGNLNRAFVRRAVERMRFPDGYLKALDEVHKAVNENDVSPLHLLRVLLMQAGFVRKYRGRFIVSKKGRELHSEEKAGQLYASVFRTYATKFNHAYVDGWPELPIVQQSLAYLLHRLSQTEGRWIDWEKEWVDLLPPQVLEEGLAEFKTPEPKTIMRAMVSGRIIHPLHAFGLIDEHYRDHASFPGLTILASIRTTPLFKRFLQFDLSS